MATLNAEQPGGWRYDCQPGRPVPQNDSPVPFTVNGFTSEQAQQHQEILRRAGMSNADQIYAGLVSLTKMQADHIHSVHDKATRQPALYPPERVKAEIHGQEPDSPEAALMSAMKKAVDTAEEAADAPVALAQNRVNEIRNGLASTNGDAAQEARNTRTRDRVLRRLSAADNHPDRANIARAALDQAKDRAELGTLLTELPSELASLGLSEDAINGVIEPVVRQRVPELAAAQDNLSDKRFEATVSHHTAGVVRRGLASGVPADNRVLEMLDPATIEKPPTFR